LSLTEEIIRHAEMYLDVQLGDHILLALTDHISFAIERAQEGIHLQNKLLQEIKILYHKEFEIGLWALQLINERMGVNMPVDEAETRPGLLQPELPRERRKTRSTCQRSWRRWLVCPHRCGPAEILAAGCRPAQEVEAAAGTAYATSSKRLCVPVKE